MIGASFDDSIIIPHDLRQYGVAAIRMVTNPLVGIIAIAFDYRTGRAATDVVYMSCIHPTHAGDCL